jgi:hypothetical protein
MICYAIAPVTRHFPVSAYCDWFLMLPREVTFHAFPAK